MARPVKQGLDYFPFDVDFFEDEKIAAISGEFGLKGEIVVVKLLCAVYRNGYFILWSDMLRLKLLRDLPGVNQELMGQIVARLVKWDFFDKSLFDSAGVLTSRGIQKRYFSASKRRVEKSDLPYLLVNANKNTEHKELMHAETPQSKVKESIKENTSTNVDVQKKGENPPSPPPSPPEQFEPVKYPQRSCIPSTPSLVAPPNPNPPEDYFNPCREYPVDIIAEKCLKEQIWVENVCMNHNLPDKPALEKTIGKFVSHCIRRGVEKKSMSDFKKHFDTYLYQQKRINKNESNSKANEHEQRPSYLDN